MNPHIRKDCCRAGRYVKKMHLTKSKYAPHRYAAKIIRKALIVQVAVPRGLKICFGESHYKHFTIMDNLADYYSIGRDHLRKRIIKIQDKKKRRTDGKLTIRQHFCAA